MRQLALVVLGVLVAVGAAAMVQRGLAAEPQEKPDAEQPKVKKAFAFTLDDQNGKKVSLSSFRGKIVVLEWMNPDCPQSLRHYKAGTFANTFSKYKAGKKPKVVWLAINSNVYGTIEATKKFADEYKVPYPILDDHLGRVGRIYGIKITPHIIIKGADGAIVYSGAVDDDPKGDKEQPLNYVAQAIDELLEGKAVSVPETEPYGTHITYAKTR
jgi:peroxiredoxin